jgi:hypothetical protein
VTRDTVVGFDNRVRVGVIFSLPAGRRRSNSGGSVGVQAGDAVRRPRLVSDAVTVLDGSEIQLELA